MKFSFKLFLLICSVFVFFIVSGCGKKDVTVNSGLNGDYSSSASSKTEDANASKTESKDIGGSNNKPNVDISDLTEEEIDDLFEFPTASNSGNTSNGNNTNDKGNSGNNENTNGGNNVSDPNVGDDVIDIGDLFGNKPNDDKEDDNSTTPSNGSSSNNSSTTPSTGNSSKVESGNASTGGNNSSNPSSDSDSSEVNNNSSGSNNSSSKPVGNASIADNSGKWSDGWILF